MELRLNNICKKYDGKVAVKDVNVTLTEGVYGLLGANGAGKTTLMRIICGIQDASSGTVEYNCMDVKSLGAEFRDLLGYLPQHFGYYPDFTAYKFLMYLASLKGLNKNFAKAKVLDMLNLVDLAQVKDKKIKTFSGGMKQRLGIAQAMLNDPKVLVLDEPTVGLDPKERVKFRNLISSLSADRIVILSTHIVSDVEYIAGEILVMKEGEIVHSGEPETITREIKGKVWECKVQHSDVNRYTSEYNVGNLKNDGGETVLRIVGDEKPMEEATEVTPTLEDLYLYYFREITEGNQDNEQFN